ncbi:hypothetical protein AB205_0072310 [Aquarana catesbeiana]|uniref:Uncharacterized protein n=1 Tax=Aquarana catesbeiana TaxID=8400 RepID=A0A2G9RIJ4_AQUCT|nr:hypothetical protein AB205_0072310 [Aquarana catesbeiana]
MVNLYPQTSVAETGDLIDFSVEEEQPDEPPAEELLSGPKFTVLCPAPTVASAFLREEVVGLSPTTLTVTSEDLVSEQRVEDLTLLAIPETGDLIDVSVEEEPPSKPPAEVLATGPKTSAPHLQQLWRPRVRRWQSIASCRSGSKERMQ